MPGMALGFLAGRNGDVQQQRLVVIPEKHTAAVCLLELVLSVGKNWKGPETS